MAYRVGTGIGETAPLPRTVSEQSIYNLNNRSIELEVIPACRHYGLGLLPYSPLDGGLLGGALASVQGGRRDSLAERLRNHAGQLEAYEKLCRDLGERPGDVALAWLLHNPDVTAPVIGPRTTEQLSASLKALDLGLSQETLASLDRIWPGPGEEAPEAYAW